MGSQDWHHHLRHHLHLENMLCEELGSVSGPA